MSEEINDKPQSVTARILSWGWTGVWFVVLGVGALFVGQLALARWNETQHPAKVETPERPAQPVKVVTASAGWIQSWVFAEGTARAVDREYLTFEMSGRVTMVGPEKSGTPVKKGEILAQLDKRRYVADVDAALASIQEAKTKALASKSDVSAADTQFELATREYARTKKLYDQKAATTADMDVAESKLNNARAAQEAAKATADAVATSITTTEAKLKQAQIILEEAEIVSPINGVVAYKNIEEGFYFTQNMVKTGNESEALQSIPFVVIDPSRYEVTLNVPAYEAGRVKVGQRVEVLPGGSSETAMLEVEANSSSSTTASTESQHWNVSGEVYSVNPAVNPGGRSVEVRIRTTGGAEHLSDGMFVTCWLATDQREDAIRASFDAFLYEENRPYVFVYKPETGTVERRVVELGIQGLTRREILSGVNDGEQVVTTGRYRLVDGAPVRLLEDDVPAKMPVQKEATPKSSTPGDTEVSR